MGAGAGVGTLLCNHLAWEHLLVARPRPGEVPRGSGGTSGHRKDQGQLTNASLVLLNRDTERNPLCLLVQEECPWGSVSRLALKNKEEFAEAKAWPARPFSVELLVFAKGGRPTAARHITPSCSGMSDSLRAPWTTSRQAPPSTDSPGTDTGVGFHFLF